VADDLESPGSHEITAELELALTAELEAAATAINTATAQRTSAG
jgi:hypothetical protein